MLFPFDDPHQNMQVICKNKAKLHPLILSSVFHYNFIWTFIWTSDDVVANKLNGKTYIQVIIAKGSESPYYINSMGLYFTSITKNTGFYNFFVMESTDVNDTSLSNTIIYY